MSLSVRLAEKSNVVFSDIYLLKSSMSDKPKKTPVEQITDKMEDLGVKKTERHSTDEDLDEEALAMKAMGLPTSFTSSLVKRNPFVR